jgi:hypothetical protein
MMSLTVTMVDSSKKNKVNHPNACFTTLCHSTDFDDQRTAWSTMTESVGNETVEKCWCFVKTFLVMPVMFMLLQK